MTEPTAPPSPAAADRPRGNLLALGLAQVFRLGSGLAINVLLMRVLGIDGFGIYGYVLTLVGLLSFSATLGMDRLINRELSRAPEETGRLVSVGLTTALLLSLLTGGLIVLSAAVLDGRATVMVAAALGALALGLQSLAAIPEAAIHAHRRMHLSVRGHLAGRVALVAGTALLLWAGAGVLSVFVAQVLDGLLVLLITGTLYRRHLGAPWVPSTGAARRALAREALPFGLNQLFGSIYLSVDVLIIGWLHDDREVGIYRGAVMIITLFPLLATTLTTGIFPRMARHLGQPEAAGAELRFVSRVLLAISLPAAVGGILTAAPLMILFGGEAFAVSALPFMVMAPLIPLRFLNNGYATTLSALDRQDDRTRGVFYAAILNLAANLAVVPAYGAVGAAATTLLTEVALAAWMQWRIQPLVTGLGLGEMLLRVGLPTAAMGGVLLLLPPSLPVVVTILLGAGLYAGLGRLSGAWHPRDLSRLRRV